MSTDRAVSEVLGYVLVISIVTIMIALVMTIGIGGLEASQQSEEINNMERAFDVLTHNANQLVEQRSPRRATELRIGDGSVGFGEAVEINVTVNGGPIDNLSVTSDPIIYEHASGEQIVYEAGAVIRTDDGGSRMISDPRIATVDNHLIVGGVRTRASSHSLDTVHESGTVLLRKEMIGTTRADTVARAGQDNISIRVESPRAEAWATYFEDEGFDDVTLSADGEMVDVGIDPDDDAKVTLLRSVIRVTLTE